MFSGLFQEKGLFNPLFSRSSQLRADCPTGDIQSLCDLCGMRLVKCAIIRPFWPGVPSGATWDQARRSAGGEPVGRRGGPRPAATSRLILAYLRAFVKQNYSWVRASGAIGPLPKHHSCVRRRIKSLLLRKEFIRRAQRGGLQTARLVGAGVALPSFHAAGILQGQGKPSPYESPLGVE